MIISRLVNACYKQSNKQTNKYVLVTMTVVTEFWLNRFDHMIINKTCYFQNMSIRHSLWIFRPFAKDVCYTAISLLETDIQYGFYLKDK